MTPGGWVLSPAYDINQIETSLALKLNISKNVKFLELGLAMEVYEFFRLNKREAEEIIVTVKDWSSLAFSYGSPDDNKS